MRRTQYVSSCASDLIIYVFAIVLKKYKSLGCIGQNVTQSTCWGAQILQNATIVYEVKIRLLHVQALNISPMASNVQITANTLVLELGLQHNLYPAGYH